MNFPYLKTEIKGLKEGSYKNVIKRRTSEMNEKEKPLVDIPTQTEVSNRLTVILMTKFEFELSKEQFWDSIRLRNDWKSPVYQLLVLVKVNLIFSTVSVARRMA